VTQPLHPESRNPLPHPAEPFARPGGVVHGITRADVMSAAQVGALLNVQKTTVEDWARRGVIPSRKRGRRRLFLRWEVEEWLVAEDV
jgi:excisionase family DNA binding protein